MRAQSSLELIDRNETRWRQCYELSIRSLGWLFLIHEATAVESSLPAESLEVEGHIFCDNDDWGHNVGRQRLHWTPRLGTTGYLDHWEPGSCSQNASARLYVCTVVQILPSAILLFLIDIV